MLVYLAHPIGHPPQREIHMANAKVWFRFLIDHTDWAISVPWLAYTTTLDEATYRDRGIRDDLQSLSRCDAVVLCGPHISPGMRIEADRAISLGMPIVDLTGKMLPEPGIVARIPDGDLVLPGRVGSIRKALRDVSDGIARIGLTDTAAHGSWDRLSRTAEHLGHELYKHSDLARKEIAKRDGTQLSLPL